MLTPVDPGRPGYAPEDLLTANATSVEANENWFHPSTSDGTDDVPAEVVEAVAQLVSTWATALGDAAPRLSGHQFRALEAVERVRGVNLTRLAEALRLAVPACSRLCGRLEAAGLLERRAHPASRREVILVVTPEGRHAVQAVTARRHRNLAAALARVPPPDRAALLRGLRALHAAGVQGPEHRTDGTHP